MTPTAPALFASTFPYALIKHARAVGELKGGAEEEFALIRKHQELGRDSPWPAYQVLGRGGQLEEVEPFYLLVSDASGSISQSRSRMAGRFWRGAPTCDVHLSVDDDIFAEAAVLRRLVTACRATRGIVTVPYLLRDGKTASVSGVTSEEDSRFKYFHARASGMGLVAMHRDVVEKLAARVPVAVDDKGLRYPCFFLEFVDPQEHGWLGEDMAFSYRLRELGVQWTVLADAPVTHAGRRSVFRSDGTFAVDAATAEGL